MDLPQIPRSEEHSVDTSYGGNKAKETTTLADTRYLPPISKLPPEMLAKIFSLLRDVQEPEPRPFHVRGEQLPPCVRKLGWMLILQVCRTWRDVAVGYPFLWKRVTFSLGRYWARCMLMRSQSVPISMRITNKDNGDFDHAADGDAELIAQHLSHAYALKIAVSNFWLEAFVRRLTQPAPILHTLRLRVLHQFRFSSQCVIARNDLLGSHTPNLRRVELNHVFVPWTSSLFAGLQHLLIEHLFRDPDYDFDAVAPTFTDFLDALDRMPALQNVLIEGPLPSYDADIHSLNPPPGARKVMLPNLEELRLGGRMLDVALVLSHLTTPLHINLELAIVSSVEDEELEIRNLFRVVYNCIAPSKRKYIAAQEMLISGLHGSLNFSAFPDSGPWDHMYLEFLDGHFDRPRIVHQFLEILPFRPILRLQISDIDFDCDGWLEAFGDIDGNASHIGSLSVEGCVLEEFCSFLGGSEIPLPNEVELPLSDLRTLIFEEHSFEDPSARQVLFDALRLRKEQEVPVELLKFIRCSSVDRDWLHDLKEVVPELKMSEF